MELASRVGERIAVPVGAAPVLLATLAVPFDPEAAQIAVDSAVETGQPLIVANVVELPFLPTSVILGYDQIDDPELSASVRAPAELAHSLGVRVERLRVRSLRPVEALLELVAERDPSFLVFGPDRTKLRPRQYRKAARAVREHAPCLVWLAA
jgi:Universal stress protein family